jgi:stress response protein SCP2
MKAFVQGQKAKLADLTTLLTLEVGVGIAAPASMVIDVSCFGIDAAEKLSDDRYFIFYNQQKSPEGAIVAMGAHGDDRERFRLNLSRLPAKIRRLVFVATIDGKQTISEIAGGFIRVLAEGEEVARYSFEGKDFGNERAIIIAELYFKDVWRFGAVGQGFEGGLSALLHHFGGEETREGAAEQAAAPPAAGTPTVVLDAPEPTTPPPPSPPVPPVPSPRAKNDLALKMERQAPGILALAQTADISLQIAGMEAHRARVALCLNISTSMKPLYTSGVIQRFIEKILALACRFDDDGVIDIFLFARDVNVSNELSLDTFEDYTHRMLKYYTLEGGANYGKVMQAVRSFYFPQPPGGERQEPVRAHSPVYVMFVTDGATIDENFARQQIEQSSYEPIFWQFMAIGKSKKDVKAGGVRGFLERITTANDFRFLEELDTMTGRYIDNANFFSTEDMQLISDKELYDLMMAEYPAWLREASEKGLLDQSAVLPKPPQTVEIVVEAGEDDASLSPLDNCTYATSHPEIYFGQCKDRTDIVSGFRFANVPVPEEAYITSATIEFTTDGPASGDIYLTCSGEASGNPKNFSRFPPETRPATSASVPWSITEEWANLEQCRTPELHLVVSELVNRPDWSPGSAMVFLFRNGNTETDLLASARSKVARPGNRRVVAYDRSPAHAAKLIIKFVPRG